MAIHSMPSRFRIAALLTTCAVALMPLSTIAQVPSPNAPATAAGDPPGRVARLNYFSGTVTMEPAGATDWSYVVLNRPLTTGDQLWADASARAELHAGSIALRLDQQTAVDIVDLDNNTTQLKVTQGTLSARIRELASGQTVEIDTPNVALVTSGPGLLRVDVAPDGSSTTVTVRDGSVTLYGDGVSYAMGANQQIRFMGTDLQQQAGGAAPAPDAFDQWVASRDHAEDTSVSARYVSREIPGYEDLDANGTWRSDPTYGEVWVPTVAVSAGWAPYHAGHWAWIAPWGWTWVDDAPWGFAPFHYGRWAYVDHAWAWVPGPVVVAQPPVYAPALVAFVGGGGGGGAHWGIDLTIGGAVAAGVAWFALGPGEPWHPAYHASSAYISRVNEVNITNVHNTTIINNVHNTYINMNAPGAIAAVPASAFVRGEPVAQAARPMTAQQIAHAQIGAGAPAVAPVRESFSGGLRAANVGAPAALAQRQVVATRPPVVPPAYHDVLAQRFAGSAGRVAGAGDPVVHTAAPAGFAHAGVATGSKPSSAGTYGNFHVINRAQAKPVAAPNAAAHGAPATGQAVHGPQPTNESANAQAHNEARPQAPQPQPHGSGAPAHDEARPQGQPAEQHAQPGAAPQGGARPDESRPQSEAPQRGGEAQRGAPHAQPAERVQPVQHAPSAAHANGPQQEQHGQPPHAEQHPQPHEQPQPQHEPQHEQPHPPQPHAQPAEHKPQGEHRDEQPHS